MKILRISAVLLGFLAVFGGVPARSQEAPPAAAVANLPKENLDIQTPSKTYRFTVEVAKTPEQQQHGLMGRLKMDENAGMLFLWPADTAVEMWMKDTPLSLDMLFIDKTGKIVYIAQKMIPNTETPIGAAQPVRGVLELLGGTAATKGIRTGDRVIYSALQP